MRLRLFLVNAVVLVLAGAALLLSPSTASAQQFEAVDDDKPAGMSDLEWAELEYSATLDTDDLYEDEAVTSEEFAAQIAALDVEMLATIEEKAAIVYPDEE